MDCTLLDDGTSADCSIQKSLIVLGEQSERMRTLESLVMSSRVRLKIRAEGILRANEDRVDVYLRERGVDIIESLPEFSRRVKEINEMIEACDRDCVLGYIREYFDRKNKKTGQGAKEEVTNIFRDELRGYLDRHPDIGQELMRWNTLYNKGNPKRSDLIQLVPPILTAIERKTGVTFGFIPVTGGVISLMKNPDGIYYAVKGDIVSKGATLERAIAPFTKDTAILQIIDSSGKAIGTVKTELSRAQEALLFMNANTSVWGLLTGDKGKSLEMSYHSDGHRVELRTPRDGFQFEVAEGEEKVPQAGTIRGQRASIGYRLSTGFSETTVSVGNGSITRNGDFPGDQTRINGTEIRINNHIHIGNVGFFGGEGAIHGIGMWKMQALGKVIKPDTAEFEGNQALILGNNARYFGYGRTLRWTPDIINKSYYDLTKEPLYLAGIKTGNYRIEGSQSGSKTRLSISEQGRDSSLQAQIEYQRRIHELLGEREIRASISYVKRF